MPTSSSTSGWNTRVPKPGATSTTNIADPSAMGRAMRVESSVTENEPTIMGSAPYMSCSGIQCCPVRNAMGSNPSTKNVVRPCWATITISARTTTATSSTQAPVIPRPMFSSWRFGIAFAM